MWKIVNANLMRTVKYNGMNRTEWQNGFSQTEFNI